MHMLLLLLEGLLVSVRLHHKCTENAIVYMYLYCCLSLPIWEDASPESRQQRTSQYTQHARLYETSNAKVTAIVLAWLTLIT